jgi:hypothetical protein
MAPSGYARGSARKKSRESAGKKPPILYARLESIYWIVHMSDTYTNG